MQFYSIGGHRGDTDFMARKTFVTKLRDELHTPTIDLTQFPTPKNQEQYDQLVIFLKKSVLPKLK
ncbi:hypothetical protein [Secundilactobacillus collinoides]|uniref:Uncharacterized protein n=2 Tax=Secundilactobacillus collinoides TaxID=33960 RepID=A0A0R2BCQ0_SECCO|nr:hypothetical protein [Secundilactobacillus collinoides]KRM76762.1 hypothetical protein FC82_GL001115 [Secundilactobacillus collinoides DSM 20515 = JCM 1123]KZL38947.1 hypothetical protein TY91_11145 [Secundilactobacillus collinoides]